jgi:hypothetical protein
MMNASTRLVGEELPLKGKYRLANALGNKKYSSLRAGLLAAVADACPMRAIRVED